MRFLNKNSNYIMTSTTLPLQTLSPMKIKISDFATFLDVSYFFLSLSFSFTEQASYLIDLAHFIVKNKFLYKVVAIFELT